MLRSARVTVVCALLCTLFVVLPLTAQTTYYLKGDPADQANKVGNDTLNGTIGTATFDTSPPTSTAPATQTGSPFATENYVGNPLAIYWSGSFSGNLTGV